ncbi:heme exporter protein CcmD [Sneathiella sp. P13V-1]|uniref:heme exporter protein CcmD n=1 Tax=Sneathiella sp. P13V-1 TaxID=2697366 RepID=UPI00187B22DE|nr:heme exporter protein CcmD [Sneathiella sp. P13V-1]MBE7636288.1 heme exporter protein CcmD [Sneathiella sp. P13V-1]
MSEFFEMGGYAAFVWSSYFVSALILITLVITSVRKLKKIEQELVPMEEARRARRQRNREGRVS